MLMSDIPKPRIKSWICFLLQLTTYMMIDGAVHKIEKNPLTDSILHFEPLNYQKDLLYHSHNRVRRSLDPRDELHLDFRAHNRKFNLRLKRDIKLFSHNADFGSNGFHPSNVYEGQLHGDPKSLVHGFIYDDIFEGRIHCGDGNEFHIESTKQYHHLNHTKFHSVIYNVRDIVHPETHMCGGVKASTQEHMNKEVNHTVWKDINENEGHIKFDNGHSRVRRASAFDSTLTECQLYIRADKTYVSYATSAEKAMYMMTQHVKSISHLYERTDFENKGTPQGITINIKRIDVIDKDACSKDTNSVDCQFNDDNIGVEKFLDLASLSDHQDFCLSYVFAHRDFSDGVLGLAWIGDKVGAGGICDIYRTISGKKKTLNTGIVTNLNYGATVAQKVTDITLAHEIGHNFGAQHDPTTGECAPGGFAGNFIMYPRATSGSDENNYNFSSCSKGYIWPVLEAKSANCFKKRGAAICGNRIVEDKEECDCGYEGEQSCLDDPCCTPASKTGGCKFSATSISRNSDTNTRCSPSLGFCCNPATCAPYLAIDDITCAAKTDCAAVSKCRPPSYNCTTPVSEPDKKECNNGSNVCINGQCTGSICLALPNKESCQCSKETNLCKVCCQTKNQTKTCDVHASGKSLPPGSPCNKYEGYCDILYKCRKVDAEGPLSRLKKWLFSSDTIENIVDWMKEYWWACILIGLGLVLFMAAFIACCSVHTPSSNPNKPPPRPMTLPRGLSKRGSRAQASAPPSHSQRPGGYRQPDNAPPGYNTATRDYRPPNYNGSMELR